MSPIIDRRSGQAVALVVVGTTGRQFLAKVDPQQPSRLLLKDQETGRVYALQVRCRAADTGRVYALQLCGASHLKRAHHKGDWGVPGRAWAWLAGVGGPLAGARPGAATTHPPSAPPSSILRPTPHTQTRVDRVNINNSLAMQRLFEGGAWERQLQEAR